MNESPSVVDAAASAAAQPKLNAYVDAYNSLVGGIGLRAVRRDYEALDISHAKSSTKLLFVKGACVRGEGCQGGACPPGTAPHDLDALADKLAPRLDALDRELGELAGYYGAMAYQEDKLVMGKERHPVVVLLFDAAASFENAVKTALAERQKARLVAFEASGDTLAYRSALAMDQARDLLECFMLAPSLQSGSLHTGADRVALKL